MYAYYNHPFYLVSGWPLHRMMQINIPTHQFNVPSRTLHYYFFSRADVMMKYIFPFPRVSNMCDLSLRPTTTRGVRTRCH